VPQLALAWALHQGDDVVPIVGTKRVQYLEEDLAAADACLSAAELAQVNRSVPEPAGERYDPVGMRTVGI
jgi:aryl-alcohol dehydrogenase-like predicted oxidoreductase